MTASSEKKIKKLVGGSSEGETDVPQDKASAGQFFFDLKAGIAKPHEKRRYLHHKKVTDFAARYDDDCFKQEAIGRAYDHAGRDLAELGDESDEETDIKKPVPKLNAQKRKIDSRPNTDKTYKMKTVRLGEKNPCWFCLSSEKLEKHLIVAIGQHCYLALAKGGLLDDHLMIMPIEHIASISDDNSNSRELLSELESFKNSLIDFFEKQSKGVVFYERNFKSVHWQLQAIPVPIDSIVSVETDIKSISKKYYTNFTCIDLPDSCSIGQRISNQNPYFFWQIEPLGTRFLLAIDPKDSSFPIHLGRMVLSDPSILNCMDKVDWKDCVKTIEEYEKIVRGIKENYNEFDITQQYD